MLYRTSLVMGTRPDHLFRAAPLLVWLHSLSLTHRKLCILPQTYPTTSIRKLVLHDRPQLGVATATMGSPFPAQIPVKKPSSPLWLYCGFIVPCSPSLRLTPHGKQAPVLNGIRGGELGRAVPHSPPSQSLVLRFLSLYSLPSIVPFHSAHLPTSLIPRHACTPHSSPR
jgi:hypothetical protein